MQTHCRGRFSGFELQHLNHFVALAFLSMLFCPSGRQAALQAQAFEQPLIAASHPTSLFPDPVLAPSGVAPSSLAAPGLAASGLAASSPASTLLPVAPIPVSGSPSPASPVAPGQLYLGHSRQRFSALLSTCCSASIPSTYFGLTVINSQLAPLLQSGTSRSWDTRPDPSWSAENSAPGVYNFADLDVFIAGNQGRDMIYTLGRTPQWASSQPNAYDPDGPGQCAPPSNLANWDNYLTAIVTHAAGKIKYWELWNEPQDTFYYCGDMPTMVLLAQHAQKIIKAIDPSAMILSPATSGGTYGVAWLNSFLSAGGAATVDIIAFHGYIPSQVAENLLPLIADYQTMMAANGVSKLPLWDTEGSGGLFTDPNQDAAFLSKYYLLQWSQGVSRFLWYGYDTGAQWGQLWNSTSGLSPAAIAYTQTQNWMAGATLTTPCAAASNGVWTCGFSRQNYQAEALWNSTAPVTVTVPAQFGQYRDFQGNIYPITNGTVTVGNNPILIETVPTASATLSFSAIPPQTFGNAPFPVFASSASAGAVTYSVVSGPATISGSIVTLTGAGTVVLGASQAVSGNFLAGTATTTINVAPGAPPVSFAAIAAQSFGVAPFQVTLLSPSAGAVTYSVVSGPATVSGSTVTLTGIGTVVLGATQSPSGNYSAGTATTSFNVVPGTPSLTFAGATPPTYGTPFALTATTPSSGAITYTLVSGPATLSGSVVTPTGVGTVKLTATQAATANFLAATATEKLTIAPAVPTLTFAPIAPQVTGSVFKVAATSASGGKVTYSVVSGSATVSGYNIIATAAGTLVLSASQAASEDYAPATATTSVTVTQQILKPVLTFAPVAPQTYGNAAFQINATSTSPAAIIYDVRGPATISGTTVTITHTGTITLVASQAAVGYYSAGSATATVVVAPEVPTLSFTPIAAQVVGTSFKVAATSASGGKVTYSVVSGSATVSGYNITPTAAGTLVLSASQAASENYTAATATTTVTVNAAGSVPALVSATAAARLLDQSSFGPTLDTISQVQSLGINGYLDQQFAAPATAIPPTGSGGSLSSCAPSARHSCVEGEWWSAVTSGPDQLRQRLAFALSEIFNVSGGSVDPAAVPQLQNALVNDAFGNYAVLMKDVALSPAMNSSASPAGNALLISIGRNLLNPDGSLQMDGRGNAIPTYNEEQAEGFSRAMPAMSGAQPGARDSSEKLLLNNMMLPAGQTAEEDLDGAVANLFNHSNAGPNLATQLIQRMVTATPSPGYVARVAAVFADNGSGVRGDMQAVVRAVLTDEEARAGDIDESLDRGTLTEPVLFVSALARGLNASGAVAANNSINATGASASTQYPFTGPSVFHLAPSDYVLASGRPMASATGSAGDSQTPAQTAVLLSLAGKLLGSAGGLTTANGVSLEPSPTTTLAALAGSPSALADALSTLFMHDQMSPAMRSEIIAAITPLTTSAQRVQTAVYLIVTSPQYNAMH